MLLTVMPDPAPHVHPPEFRQLCEDAADRFRALAAAAPGERARLIGELRTLLARIDREMDELDLTSPAFAHEQGLLVNASTALQSIDLDRGGPHVGRYAERAIADLLEVAG